MGAGRLCYGRALSDLSESEGSAYHHRGHGLRKHAVHSICACPLAEVSVGVSKLASRWPRCSCRIDSARLQHREALAATLMHRVSRHCRHPPHPTGCRRLSQPRSCDEEVAAS